MTDQPMPLPNEFVTRLRTQLNADTVARVILALSSPRPTTLRANPLRGDRETLKATLAAGGFGLERVPWYVDAFVLRSGTLRDLTNTVSYTSGALYVQTLSSMLPPLILAPKPGETVLDIAAAPGSKTTQMAALMGNTGSITANDASRTRMFRLEANVRTQGVGIVRFEQQDARNIWQKYPESFDRVLADVPCTMEGRFLASDPTTYEDWSLKKVSDLSHLQRWILRSAVSAAKVGGTIVYSTCTINPEENEEVVDWILTKEKGNIELSEIVLDGVPRDPPVLHWGNKKYDQHMGNCLRILPTELFEGFFIAKFRKLRRSVPKAAVTPTTSSSLEERRTVFHPHTKKLRK